MRSEYTLPTSIKGEKMLKQRANIATRKIYILVKISFALLILLLLLSSATYTWFAISRTPTVNNMQLYINSPAGMSLSWDADGEEKWEQHLNFSEKFTVSTILKPVTYSFNEDCFYAAKFGVDGRMESIGLRLYDDRNANHGADGGYYVKSTFYATADTNIKVSLLSPDKKAGTYVIGTPVWNDDEIVHVNGGGGAQYAVRIGLRITPINSNGDLVTENARFVIYEPNAINHVNYNGDYIKEYVPTPSIDKDCSTLVPEGDLIRQDTTLWVEADPVQKDVVIYRHGNFLDDTYLFDLKEGEKVQIDMYLWLEGQDPDCSNHIGSEAKIFSSIQFHVEMTDQGGMDEIQ